MARIISSEERLNNAIKAENSWDYFTKQRGKRPVSEFIASYPFLKSIVRDTQDESSNNNLVEAKIKGPWSFFGYEVASRELRGFIQALVLLKKAQETLEKSRSHIDNVKKMTKQALTPQNLAKSEKARYNQTEELKAYKLVLASAIELWPEELQEIKIAEKRRDSKRKDLRVVEEQFDNTVLSSGKKFTDKKLERAQDVAEDEEKNYEHIKVRENLHKDMLVAALRQDLEAFNNAFTALEKYMSIEEPEKYASGAGSGRDLYRSLSFDMLTLKGKHKKLFLAGDDKSGKFNIEEYISSSKDSFINHLNLKNKFSVLNTQDAPKKIKSFLISAAKIRKNELEMMLSRMNCKVKKRQKEHDRFRLQKSYNERSTAWGYAGYSLLWLRSWFTTISVKDDDNSEPAKQLSEIIKERDELQSELQGINAAKAYIYGYNIPKLQAALKVFARSKGTGNCLYKCATAKLPEETLIESVISDIQELWHGLCANASPYTAAVWDKITCCNSSSDGNRLSVDISDVSSVPSSNIARNNSSYSPHSAPSSSPAKPTVRERIANLFGIR